MALGEAIQTWGRLATAAVDRRVQYLILFVTARCNLLCKHCFYTDEILNAKSKKELALQEYQQIAAKAGKVLQVSLTGGEPFIRRDLGEIILAFRERAGALFFNVTTNGLLERQILETLEGVFARAPELALRLGLSIDGSETVHDKTRDKAGSFRQTLSTARALASLRRRYRHFTVHVSTTLTSYNAREIRDFIDFVRDEMDVDAHYLGFIRGQVLDPETKQVTLADYERALRHLKRRWVSKNRYQNLLNGVNALMGAVNRYTLEGDRYFFPCVAGEKMLTIDEEGKVKPCEILEQRGEPHVMGDLRQCDYDLYAAIRTPGGREIRRRILEENCHCTFECANQASIAYKPANFAKALGLYASQRL